MADDGVVDLGDQRYGGVAVAAQLVDKVGLVGAGEGGGDDGADGGVVCSGFGADLHARMIGDAGVVARFGACRNCARCSLISNYRVKEIASFADLNI